MRTLTTNQAEAVEKFARLKVGALFMACGTGKTQAAVSIINSVENVGLLYWLCPCRVKDNLRAELEKCGCRYNARIIGIESIGCSDRIYLEELEHLKQFKRVFMVCDESIKVKNLRAKRTRRILELAKHSAYRLILNGTPVTKNIIDIYAQMQFLSSKILPYSYLEFRNRYCKYYQIKQGWRIKKTVITGFANIDHLLSVIRPYVYQCDLELKVEKRYHVCHWAMTYEEANAYQELKQELFYEYQNCEGEINMVAVFSKLQHSYALCEDKFAELEAVMTDRTIVFCKYKVSEAAVRERFPDAMVLTYGKGSFGLNLQKYNRVIYFDKTFDYSFREQSEGRIYRNGQTLDCEYYDLTGDVGLEQMIDDCIEKKETLVNYFKKMGNKVTKENLKQVLEKL
jgi:SNF2 family DNA or RNA helicase